MSFFRSGAVMANASLAMICVKKSLYLTVAVYWREVQALISDRAIADSWAGICSVMTHATFVDSLGSKFTLHIAPDAVREAELIEVRRMPSVAGQLRDPFSLIFRTSNNLSFAQRIYKLEHATLGELQIFLVPIGPDSQGMRLEAVFN